MPRIALFVAILAFVVAFDQGSKAWARRLPVAPVGCTVPDDLVARRCAGVPQPVVDGYWDWELAANPGIAFSTFAGRTGTRVILSLIAAAALVAIGVAALRARRDQRLRRAAYALIAGGTLGNLIDRLRDGGVTDFIRWKIHDHLWPIFNVADAALLIGVAVLFVERALAHREKLGTPSGAT
jgi:signal peptidase II